MKSADLKIFRNNILEEENNFIMNLVGRNIQKTSSPQNSSFKQTKISRNKKKYKSSTLNGNRDKNELLHKINYHKSKSQIHIVENSLKEEA